MSAEILRMLVDAALASTLALLCVALLRRPLRATAGARTGCWLWLLVPAATLAVLLPAPSRVLLPTVSVLPTQFSSSWLVVSAGDPGSSVAPWMTAAFALWMAGALVMLSMLSWRQWRFSRSLGQLTWDPRGWYRSDGVSVPLLVGAWRSRIVVPEDFEARYTCEERELVLAHEQAHRERGDVAVNAMASIALCLFWFNPLMYRALAWLRMDQELACDELVLARRADARQSYANALLKTQLASESAWRTPIGCHWQSVHPLTERILMLKKTPPGFSRRLSGLAFSLVLAGGAGYAAWAGGATQARGPSILVDLKVTISNPKTNEVQAFATRYVVHSGEEIVDANARPLQYACTPFLPDEPGRSTDWAAVKAAEVPAPMSGQILMICKIRRNGQVVMSPAVIAGDGKWATIETSESGGRSIYRIELNAVIGKEG